MAPITKIDFGEDLPLIASGKVRDLYKIDEHKLLFVATDRISAFDVIMKNGINQKGAILTQLSEFWFKYLQSAIPTLQSHFISIDLPPALLDSLPSHTVKKVHLQERSMVVRRLKILPIESIVRGYITGSAWNSYQKDGTVCGIKLPTGLRESEELHRPLWTPSTKAELGETDENISPEEAAKIVGKEHAAEIEALSIQIYEVARDYAAERGIIIADTKFEFGLDESISPAKVVLSDEVLTPDSSRFWNAHQYEVGRGQESYDKQGLRDWLLRNGLKGKEGVEMPPDVVANTLDRYKEAYQTLTGKRWFAACIE